MPVPTPRSGEKEKDFIERCMHKVGGEDNAIAMCYSAWNNRGRPEGTLSVANHIVRRILTDPVRAVDGKPGRVKSYAAIWGDEEHQDWYGTWFTRDTDFALDWYDQRPWLYDHTMNSFVGAAKIGSWKDADLDDHGLFFLGELDSRFRYLDEVEFLMEMGYLFPSSGTLSHAMQVADDGWIRRWPIAELSSTTSPAEFRIPAQSIDASRRKRAAEAIRRLGGLTMSEETQGNVAQALFPGVDLRTAPPDAEPVTPARATDPTIELETEVDAAQDTSPGEEAPEEEDVEIQDGAVTLQDVQSAILNIDGAVADLVAAIRAMNEESQALRERVDALEHPPAQQLSDLVSSRNWTDQLFCSSRSGRAITNRDVGNDGDPQAADEPLSPSDALLAQLGSIGGVPAEGADILSQIVASQRQ